MAYERRDIVGGAVATTLSSSLLTAATSTTITAATGWPSGSAGKFYCVVDEGLSNEEKILVTTRSTLTLSSISRAQDGTSASDHQINAVIRPIGAAKDFDEANYMVNQLAKVTTAEDLLVATGAAAYKRLGKGSDGQFLQTASGALAWGSIPNLGITTGMLADSSVTTGKIADGTIASADTGFTASTYTPTLTQSGAVTKTVTHATYFQLGKLIIANIYLAVTGTGTTNNTITVSLPVTAAKSSGIIGSGTVFDNSLLSHRGSLARLVTTSTFDFIEPASGTLNPVGQTPNFGLASPDTVAAAVIYEAA